MLVVPVVFLLVMFVVPVAAVFRVGLETGPSQMLEVMGAGRTWQLDWWFHSTSITGGRAPFSFGTLRMNHSACDDAVRHQ